MTRTRPLWVFMMIAAISVILVSSAAAQDTKGGSLEEFDNGYFVFSYPDGWTVTEFDNPQLVMVYSDGRVQLDNLAFDREEGSYLIRLIYASAYDNLGDPAAIVGYEYRAWMDYLVEYDVLENQLVIEPVETGVIDDIPYAILKSDIESSDGRETETMFIAAEIQRGEYIVMAGFADSRGRETLQTVMIEMLPTIEMCSSGC
mgnify:CR=1 FL=1